VLDALNMRKSDLYDEPRAAYGYDIQTDDLTHLDLLSLPSLSHLAPNAAA
jgi:hypothetical protein